MKLPLSIVIIFFIGSLAHSQTIRLSQKHTVQHIEYPVFTSYLVNDYYYVVQDRFNMKSPINRDVQMDVFDNKGEFVATTGIVDATMSYTEPNIYEGIFPLKEHMALFKSQYKKEGESKHYDLYYYAFANLTERGNGVKLTSIISESGTNTGNFEISTSPDGSRIAVISQQPFRKTVRENITLAVYDNSFKELWNKTYEFPFDNAKSPGNTVWVSNSGSVFILKNVENKTENAYQSIIAFTNNGNTVKENRITLGTDGKFASYKTAFNTQGDIIIAGLYFNDRKFGINVEKPKGNFYIKINSSDGAFSVSAFNPKDFPSGTKTVSINLGENDEVIITAEEQMISSTSIPDKPFEYNNEYKNKTIHVMKLGNKGEPQWEHVVKRTAESYNDGAKTLSVFTGIINGNVTLIFRDYYYKYDGQKHAVISFQDLGKHIYASRVLDKEGNILSDSYIKRLGNDESKEAVIIGLMPVTGRQQDEKNVLFMGCTDKMLYGVKVSF